ncbi:NlpC/P60 family protein [Aureimonas pseudogalii]|uniref:NlpC/P60 family putative phage cell wall peptidase n=1 Tax=Aureimonas pseudogalii TaxID=1744844 RepID=A0A7W6E957_9HYPH|nr:NlpC/P60 family protein [Aureimonas pseudogalii]MBB3996564.1 NlpC/P60 family putative phage cell wall peptidase [Aureimonas pseudogalii]
MRARVLAVAATFLGTPYRHQGSTRGVGCDCLGLVRGVWRELYGAEPESPAPYAADWAETEPGDPLLAAARRHFLPVAIADAMPGDLVLFRWRAGGAAKHCGILGHPDSDGSPRLLHAYEGVAVVSSPLTPGWASRITAAFRFPEGD